MTLLDGYNVIGTIDPPAVFGVDADAIFVDASPMTVRTGKGSPVTNTWHAGGESCLIQASQNADPYNAPMPFAGKVIGFWWHVITVGGYAGNHTMHLKINGVRVVSNILVVGEAGTHISDPLSQSFAVGDRVEIERVRDGNTTLENRGCFCMAVKWD